MNSFPLFCLFCLGFIFQLIDTHVTWGLNLGRNNLSAAFLEAKAIVNVFKSASIKNAGIVLEAIEIGNEADLYSNNGARPKDFTSTEYVAECVLILLSARNIFTHMIPPCQMDRICYERVCNRAFLHIILGRIFCCVFTFYQRLFATSYLRGGDSFIFPRFYDFNVRLLF